MQQLTGIATEVLSHIEVYLDQLEDEAYKTPLPLLSGASIGGHTRHVLDGFLCIIRQHSGGTISYDKRERDKRTECEVCYAREQLDFIKDYISSLASNDTFDFEVNYADQTFTTATCLEREIIHNIEHVIHHLAIVKIALLHYHPSIEIPNSFGVAPSTLRYWKESGKVKNEVSNLKVQV